MQAPTVLAGTEELALPDVHCAKVVRVGGMVDLGRALNLQTQQRRLQTVFRISGRVDADPVLPPRASVCRSGSKVSRSGGTCTAPTTATT